MQFGYGTQKLQYFDIMWDQKVNLMRQKRIEKILGQ